jgi:hypothetical protein
MKTKSGLRDTIGFIGVIASLALVAYEVRQNTKAVRGQTLQSIAEQAAEISFLGVNNPDLRAALSKGFDGDPSDMTVSDRSILAWWYAGVMRITENRFRQYQLGVVGQESLGQLGGYAMAFRNAYFKDWWPGVRYQFQEDFAQYVDTTLIPLRLPDR